MLTRRSRRKSRSYILFDESRMLRNERALFQTWLFKTPRYFLKTFSFLPGFTIAQTKSQFNPKIVTSPKLCILPKFICLFLYILSLFIIVNGFYVSATLCSDIIPHKHTLQFFLKIYYFTINQLALPYHNNLSDTSVLWIGATYMDAKAIKQYINAKLARNWLIYFHLDSAFSFTDCKI